MEKTIVAIIDRQTLFRVGACYILAQQPDFVVHEINPDGDVLLAIEVNSPDVILLDIDNPSLRGLDLARKITMQYPTVRIVMLTFEPDDKQLFEIIKTGVVAYLEKSVTSEELVKAVREVSTGQYPINEIVLSRPEVAVHVLRQFQNIHGTNGKTIESIVAPLTSRETQILNCIADGNSNKQIASILQISEQTAKNHVSNILRKLNANDRAHAVVLAIRHGWISAEELEVPGIAINSN